MELPIKIDIKGIDGVKETTDAILSLGESLKNASSAELQSTLNNLRRVLYEISVAADNAKNKNVDYKQSLIDCREATRAAISEIERSKTVSDSVNKSYDELEKNLTSLTKAYKKARDSYEDYSTRQTNSAKQQNNYNQRMNEAVIQMQEVENKMGAVKSVMESMAAPIQKGAETLGELRAAFSELTNGMTESDKQSEVFLSSVKSVSSQIDKLALSLDIATASEKALIVTQKELAKVNAEINVQDTQSNQELLERSNILSIVKKEQQALIQSEQEHINKMVKIKVLKDSTKQKISEAYANTNYGRDLQQKKDEEIEAKRIEREAAAEEKRIARETAAEEKRIAREIAAEEKREKLKEERAIAAAKKEEDLRQKLEDEKNTYGGLKKRKTELQNKSEHGNISFNEINEISEIEKKLIELESVIKNTGAAYEIASKEALQFVVTQEKISRVESGQSESLAKSKIELGQKTKAVETAIKADQEYIDKEAEIQANIYKTNQAIKTKRDELLGLQKGAETLGELRAAFSELTNGMTESDKQSEVFLSSVKSISSQIDKLALSLDIATASEKALIVTQKELAKVNAEINVQDTQANQELLERSNILSIVKKEQQALIQSEQEHINKMVEIKVLKDSTKQKISEAYANTNYGRELQQKKDEEIEAKRIEREIAAEEKRIAREVAAEEKRIAREIAAEEKREKLKEERAIAAAKKEEDLRQKLEDEKNTYGGLKKRKTELQNKSEHGNISFNEINEISEIEKKLIELESVIKNTGAAYEIASKEALQFVVTQEKISRVESGQSESLAKSKIELGQKTKAVETAIKADQEYIDKEAEIQANIYKTNQAIKTKRDELLGLGKTEKEVAEKSIWTWENFSNVTSRMGLRMAASLIWWTLIIDAAQKIFEIWTKVSDEEQTSIDRLKEYGDTMKDIAKGLLDMPGTVNGKTRFDKRTAENEIDVIKNQVPNRNYESYQRFKAYQDLRSMSGDVLSDVRQEEFVAHINSDRGKRELDTVKHYLDVKDRLEAGREKEGQVTSEIEKGKELRSQLKEEWINKELSGNGEYSHIDKRDGSLITANDIGLAHPDYQAKRINHENLSEQERDELRKKLSSVYDKAADKGNFKQDNTFEGALFDAKEYLKRMGSGRDLESFIKADSDVRMRSEVQKNILIPLRDKNIKDEQEIYALDGKPKDKKVHTGFKDDYMIAREKEIGESNKAKSNIDLEFAESKGSVHDIERQHNQLEEEAKRHFDEMSKINQLALDKKLKTHKSEEEIKNYQQEDEAKKRESDAKNMEATRNLVAQEQKAQNERIAHAEEQLEKIGKINKDLIVQRQEAEDAIVEAQSRSRKAANINPVAAFFGWNGESEGMNREEDIKRLNLELSHKSEMHSHASLDAIDANADYTKKKSTIDSNSEFHGMDINSEEYAFAKHSGHSKESIEQYEFDYSEFVKAKEKKMAAEDEMDKTKNSKDKAQSDLDLYKQEKKKQDEIKIAQAIGDATKKIAKESFDFKIKQIEIEKENLQGLYDFEMKLAGNNATAKQRIEIETHQKMLSLKRQEAKVQKEEAIFGAIIGTAEAVVKAYQEGGPVIGAVLAAIVGAVGAAQIATIASQPLPQYRKGGMVSNTGLAQINEEGFELIERNGQMMVFQGGVAQLQKGDYVHTHQKSLDMMTESRYVDDLKNGASIYKQFFKNEKKDFSSHIAQQLTKKDMEDAMTSAILKMKQPIIQMPVQSVQDRHILRLIRNGL